MPDPTNPVYCLISGWLFTGGICDGAEAPGLPGSPFSPLQDVSDKANNALTNSALIIHPLKIRLGFYNEKTHLLNTSGSIFSENKNTLRIMHENGVQ